VSLQQNKVQNLPVPGLGTWTGQAGHHLGQRKSNSKASSESPSGAVASWAATQQLTACSCQGLTSSGEEHA